MKVEIEALLDAHSVIARRHHPELTGALDWALRRRQLGRVLPGVYARLGVAHTLLSRARAARLLDPECVVTGPSAATLMGWTWAGPPPDELSVASTRLRPRPGLRVAKRRVPRGLTRMVDGVRTTSRALTALELVDTIGTTALDEALRLGVRLIELDAAASFLRGTRGQRTRRRALRESRDRPFSAAERAAHAALRGASGLPRWAGNVEFCDDDGHLVAVGDIVIASLRLVLEIDGRAHREPDQVVRDHRKNLWFARRGWQVTRIEAALPLGDPDGFVHVVREVCAGRARWLPRRRSGKGRRRPGLRIRNSMPTPSDF